VEYWAHEQGEDVVIMKGCLGVLAIVIGFNLLVGGIIGTYLGCAYLRPEPEISAFYLKYGMIALLLGLLLCSGGVWLARHIARE
jgi:hypothetical protein